jgi:MFS superfamily sulfate permease-like transporter
MTLLVVLVFLFGLLLGVLVGMILSMVRYNSMLRHKIIVPGPSHQ